MRSILPRVQELTLVCSTLIASELASASTVDKHLVIANALRDGAAGFASVNRSIIRDVIFESTCKFMFVTDSRNITVDWQDVGDFAPQFNSGTESIILHQKSGNVTLNMPEGKKAERIESSLSVMLYDCNPKKS